MPIVTCIGQFYSQQSKALPAHHIKDQLKTFTNVVNCYYWSCNLLFCKYN